MGHGMGKKITNLFKDFSKTVKYSNIPMNASSSAFFVFLSFIPIILLICSILPLTGLSISNIFAGLEIICPPAIMKFIDSLFFEINNTSATKISISFIVTLWVAGKGFWAIMSGLNEVNGVIEKRNGLYLRIWGTIYTLAFMFTIILAFILLVVGNNILAFLNSHIPQFSNLFELIKNIKGTFAWFYFTLVFMTIYTVVPNVRLNFFKQFPGALFATVGWYILSMGFSFYLARFGNFSMYGSLATIIITMLWLYYDMYIIFIGAIINQFFNAFWEKKRKEREMLERSYDED